jgi:hypothetical protein
VRPQRRRPSSTAGPARIAALCVRRDATSGWPTRTDPVSVTAKGGDPRFKCCRCHKERVDSLRLVLDAHECSVDEAADSLLTA